jgi:hypothetical protein
MEKRIYSCKCQCEDLPRLPVQRLAPDGAATSRTPNSQLWKSDSRAFALRTWKLESVIRAQFFAIKCDPQRQQVTNFVSRFLIGLMLALGS